MFKLILSLIIALTLVALGIPDAVFKGNVDWPAVAILAVLGIPVVSYACDFWRTKYIMAKVRISSWQKNGFMKESWRIRYEIKYLRPLQRLYDKVYRWLFRKQNVVAFLERLGQGQLVHSPTHHYRMWDH